MTAYLDHWRPNEMNAETDEEYISYDLRGNDERVDPDHETPGFGVELVFQSWTAAGEPAGGVEFSWQALGEARYASKRPKLYR